MKRIKNNEGFLIIEVIVSIAILSIVFAAVAGVLLGTYRTNDMAQNLVISHKACEEVIERLVAMDYAQLPNQDGVQFEVRNLIGMPSPAKIGLIRVRDVSGGMGTLYEINVSINYNGLPHPIRVNLVTRRAKL